MFRVVGNRGREEGFRRKPSDIHTCIHKYIHTYMYMYMHTNIHICIQTYIHILIHTYIYTFRKGRDIPGRFGKVHCPPCTFIRFFPRPSQRPDTFVGHFQRSWKAYAFSHTFMKVRRRFLPIQDLSNCQEPFPDSCKGLGPSPGMLTGWEWWK